MKALRMTDEDYGKFAHLAAQHDPELFTRVFATPLTRSVSKKKEAPAADGTNMQYFEAAWDAWPKEVKGKWITGQGYEKRVVLKGSKKIAMDNFFALLPQATARELYAAAISYLTEAPSVKEGYVQNVSTFYGPKKATVLEWLDRAKELIEQQDARGLVYGG